MSRSQMGRHGWRVATRVASIAATTAALWSSHAHARTSNEPGSEDLAQDALAEDFNAELRAELDSYIQGALVAFDVPGAAVAVLDGGRVAYRGAFGVRGERHPGPVDTHTLFMVGSVGKSMTSTMIATLVDDGIIDWDVPVERLLPTFELAEPAYTPLVTLRHLLSHQSGLSRWDVSLFLGPLRPLDVVEEVGAIPVHSAPGERYEYQNQAYTLAGFAAARAAFARYANDALARGYERLMHERVFGPVGMRRSLLDFGRAIRSENHAFPNEYSPLSGDVRAVQLGFERFATSVAPAGAVWSNIEDMARYALLHLGDGRNVWGRRVVSEANLEETHTPMLPSDGGSYGLGWVVADSPFGRVVTHDGGTAGFGADVVLLPDLGWGVVVLTNRASSAPFIQAVERYTLDVLLGRERTPDGDLQAVELALRAELAALLDFTAPVQPGDVTEFLGTYERDVRFFQRGPDLVLRNEFGDLTLRAAVGYPGAFLVVGNTLAGAVAQFGADAGGNVSVTVGLPAIDGEDVQLLQPVTLAKVQRSSDGHRAPRWTRDPHADWWRTVHSLRARGVRTRAARWFR